MLVYDPRKGDTIKERLSLQGNPAINDDWWIHPKTGDQVDFIDFCRSEGRFGKHFDRDGNPSDMLAQATQERLENWHQLQELAGVLGKKSAVKEKPAATPAKPKPAAGNGQRGGLPSGFQSGAKIRYDGGEGWVNGVLASVAPVVMSLADDTEIEISPDVMREAIALGLVALQ